MSKYLVFANVGIMLLISSLSTNSVAVAFPQIQSSFEASLLLASWVLAASTLAIVAVSPIAGKVSDTFGRKRTFLFFTVLFTAGSVLCAIAPNIYLLIVFRFIQGAGTGAFVAAAAGIFADTFPESRQRSIGLITTLQTFGNLTGPVLGGWITMVFGWREVFWFCVPWGVVAMVCSVVFMKGDGNRARARIDLGGAVLFATSLSALMIGLTLLGSGGTGMTLATAVGLMAVGIAVMALFARHETRTDHPIIDLQILRGRPFMSSNIYNITYGFAVGASTFVPLYAVTVYGISAVQSGWLLSLRGTGLLIASVVSSFSLVRWGYRKPLLAGTAAIATCCVVLGFETRGFSVHGVSLGGTFIVAVALAVSGIGMGLCAPAAANACIELMPDRVSALVGTRRMFMQTGQILGITITSIVLAGFGQLTRGFQVAFIGSALITLLGVPFIMGMPRSPSDIQKRLRTGG